MHTEQILADKHIKSEGLFTSTTTETVQSLRKKVGTLERCLIMFAMNMQVLLIACKTLKKPLLIWKTLIKMISLRKNIRGSEVIKLQKVNGKYYLHLFAPGWPSSGNNAMIKQELLKQSFPLTFADKVSFIFFAITRRCPLRCEHCFEWNNLNHKETFSKEELMQVADIYQHQGVLQIHFSGGEPMVRMHDLLEVIKYASPKSECYVLTSGLNLTWENALLLKQNGCTGITISIDHYIEELHNSFRHNATIFRQAVEAVKHSLKAGMLTTITVCITREFIAGGHLFPYLEFAKKLDVHFVQLLEPRAVGHFAGKNVLLEEYHLKEVEDFFIAMNSNPKYKDYPSLLYHGFHQRRMGCYTGSHSVYIDSVGDVHACPFCHTKSYNIKTILQAGNKTIPVRESFCPSYERTA